MKINKVSSNSTGNFRPGGNFNPAKIRGFWLHPYNTDMLTTSEISSPKTNMQSKMVANAYKDRAFFFHVVGMMENNGEGPAYESRGQFKNRTDKGTWDKIFTFLSGTWAEYQMQQRFDGRHKQFCVTFIDENNVLRHTVTDTGIAGFRLHALETLPFEEPEEGKAVKYRMRIALQDINEINTASHSELGFNPFHPISGLQGVDDAVLKDVTAGVSAGVFHINIEGVDREINLVEQYATELASASAWVVTNATGAPITVSSVAVLTSGTDKIAFALTLNTSDPDYTAAAKAYIKLESLSVLAGLGVKYLEGNTIEVTLT